MNAAQSRRSTDRAKDPEIRHGAEALVITLFGALAILLVLAAACAALT